MVREKKVHIVMVGSAVSLRGGMSQVVRQLLGHEWGPEMEIQYLASHAPGSAFKRCRIFLAAYFKLLLLLLWGGRVDIAHLHMSYKGSFWRKYLICRLLKRFHRPVLLHLHGSEFKAFYDNAGRWQKRQIRWLLGVCDRVLVLGSYWELVILEIQPRARTVVLPNAVPLPAERAQWQTEPFRVLYLGVLIGRKGICDLLAGFQRLREALACAGKGPELVIAGTGEQEAELRGMCEQLGLTGCVTFAGWVEGAQKAALLASSQCLVLPSYHEGLPVVILEALSYGLPVVATGVGSVSDAVIDGYNGRLIPTHAPEALAMALKDVMSDQAQWEQMSAHARQLVSRRFASDQFFARLVEIYLALADGGGER